MESLQLTPDDVDMLIKAMSLQVRNLNFYNLKREDEIRLYENLLAEKSRLMRLGKTK